MTEEGANLAQRIGGKWLGVVTGFIRSASRMEEHIFAPRCGLRISFAERLKPLTTGFGGGKWYGCCDRIYPVSGPDGASRFCASLCCVPRLLSG